MSPGSLLNTLSYEKEKQERPRQCLASTLWDELKHDERWNRLFNHQVEGLYRRDH